LLLDIEFDRVPPRLFRSLQARQDEAFQKISAAVPYIDDPKAGFFFGSGVLFNLIPRLGQDVL
jgi:hypothetical protein